LSGRETVLIHVESSGNISEGLKYKAEAGTNFPNDIHSSNGTQRIACTGELENRFEEFNNTTFLVYQSIGDEYYSPGNLFYNNTHTKYGIRTVQGLFKEKVSVSGSFDKTVYGKSASEQYILLQRSLSITTSLFKDLRINYLSSFNNQHKRLNENESKSQESFLNNIVLNYHSSIIFTKEIFVLNILRSVSSDVASNRRYITSRIGYNGNFNINDRFSLLTGFSYTENDNLGVLYIQKNVQAGAGYQFSRKGSIRILTTRIFDSHNRNSIDYSMQCSYSFNKHIRISATSNTKYYFNESMFMYERTSGLYRAVLTYKF
jgi:hypothetical protein